MEDFKKYGLANLKLRAVHTQDDPVLAELTKEMDEVNAIVNVILNQFAKIDSSIKAKPETRLSCSTSPSSWSSSKLFLSYIISLLK